MTADAETRRAKKRQTDRNAQRQHRKRQKQYIEGLEAQISLLKSAGKSEASQLAAQNLQLQDELQQMRRLWDEMENILQRQRDLRSNSILNVPLVCSDGSPTPSYDSNNERDASAQAFAVRSASFNDTAQVRPTVHPAPAVVGGHLQSTGLSDLDGLMLHDSTSTHDLPDNLIHCDTLDLHDGSHLLNTDGNEMDSILRDDFALANMDRSDESDRATTELTHSQSLTARNKDSDHFYTIDSSQIQTPRAHESDSAMTMRWITSPSHLLREADDIDHFPEVEDGSPHHQERQRTPDPLDGFTELFDACMKHNLPAFRSNMPLLMFSSASKDVLLHEMIQRASQNPESIGPPVLIDFLVDNKQNSLSTDLKVYLEPVRKTRRTSEYLATYWVLYLLLRWQIVRSEDAYHSLPPWLRPTPLQLVVHHPMAADLIAWPAIREGLVQMSMSDPDRVYDVSTDIGKYLTVEISTSESDLVHDPQQLVSKILDLNNWKLDKEFFHQYPQWKGNTT
ncbi:uncharacterized protein FFUJ_12679 [Fusarium fujikuroi IMI 58289]|uniref:BZIP domain-containing protein n=1 Tax=Gibberella fujikuroi (strain CBS 195.34 / IMI 58289 / NRRL A-6831) TaxID=1279085 RepID=S0ECX1_GIBF5|nr:uncharacterized protein FFUJ_12679 [Fusarium fujikuroi IMI 58289]QGI68417.1 hypothetical protein CEK27_012388 [Fusarium fujikuroi]CCT72786.1 uncharacterized protein FFUJ_12679 [Fusarium fujikuroi IMI 58289]SCO25235.1 uncharacterized protein FFM5_14024 [Fusarium fujikuroi]SCO54269.1 uncharacterized protein FFMR_11725 [Fusarium fujikuroi]